MYHQVVRSGYKICWYLHTVACYTHYPCTPKYTYHSKNQWSSRLSYLLASLACDGCRPSQGLCEPGFSLGGSQLYPAENFHIPQAVWLALQLCHLQTCDYTILTCICWQGLDTPKTPNTPLRRQSAINSPTDDGDEEWEVDPTIRLRQGEVPSDRILSRTCHVCLKVFIRVSSRSFHMTKQHKTTPEERELWLQRTKGLFVYLGWWTENGWFHGFVILLS